MLAAIGDVHGCAKELNLLLDKVIARFGDRSGTIIMLGDYVDRGYDSKTVLDRLMQWSHPTIKMICLKGNHDEMMLRAILHNDDIMRRVWLDPDSGGQKTVEQLGSDIVSYAEWMETLPSFYRTDKLFFVHAGIDPDAPLADQKDSHMLWIRDRFLRNKKVYENGTIIVHGHTPTYEPDEQYNRIGVDTGCVFGEALTAVLFDDDEKLMGYESVKRLE